MKRRIVKKQNRSKYISAYAVSRHYGGCEEGGWWYDWYEQLGYCKISNQKKISQYHNILMKNYGHYQQVGYRRDGTTYNLNRFSVNGNGYDLIILMENKLGENESTNRPRYE